jgi:hypothetical protein
VKKFQRYETEQASEQLTQQVRVGHGFRLAPELWLDRELGDMALMMI